jgi:hypothetical protein
MAPPIAASDHFTSGDSKNGGIVSSDQYLRRKVGCEGGIFGAEPARSPFWQGGIVSRQDRRW